MLENIFNRKRRDALKLMESKGSRCAKCGKIHAGIMEIAFDAPDFLPRDTPVEANKDIRFEGNFLSEDFAVLDGKHFFVRCVLAMPVLGMTGEFGIGCWSSLSEKNFEIYLNGFDHNDYEDWGPWTSWLSNNLPIAPLPEHTPMWMVPQPDRKRPLLRPHESAGELYQYFADGLPPEVLVELYKSPELRADD